MLGHRLLRGILVACSWCERAKSPKPKWIVGERHSVANIRRAPVQDILNAVEVALLDSFQRVFDRFSGPQRRGCHIFRASLAPSIDDAEVKTEIGQFKKLR